MATIVNARDVILQAASPRVAAVTLPSNVTVPNTQVSGLGSLATKNTVVSSDVSGLGALATQNVVNLATQVTGLLTSGSISGLGALALLNQVSLGSAQVTGSLPVGSVTGLGALATQNTVNANTQVTNLGTLAYANYVAANLITTGTLVAGVTISGSVDTANYIHAYGSNPSAVSTGVGSKYPTIYGQSDVSNGVAGLFIASGSAGIGVVAKTSTTSAGAPAGHFDGGSYAIGVQSRANNNYALDAVNYSASYAAAKIGNSNAGSKALELIGSLSIDNSNIVSNLNAQYLQNKTPSDFATYNHGHDGVYLKIMGGAVTGKTASGAYLPVSNGSTTVYIPIYT